MTALNEPKLTDRPPLRIAGFESHYTREQTSQIPAQWDRFNLAVAASGLLPADDVTYAVVYPTTPMRYLTGVAVGPETPLPEGWVAAEVPAQHYAIFAETGGVDAMRSTWPLIYSDWLPGSGYKPAAGPMLERYDAGWATSGDFEIWIPVEAK